VNESLMAQVGVPSLSFLLSVCSKQVQPSQVQGSSLNEASSLLQVKIACKPWHKSWRHESTVFRQQCTQSMAAWR